MSYQKKSSQEIVDLMIYQIIKDVKEKDLTVIEEFLKSVPKDVLMNFLPEDINEDDMNAMITSVNTYQELL